MEIKFVRKIKDIGFTSYSNTMLVEAMVNGVKEKLVLKKIIDKVCDDSQSFSREVDALTNLANPNILKFFGYLKEERHIYTKFFDGLCLSDYISNKGKLKLKETLPIFSQCASALEFVHSPKGKKGYVHYDISGRNYLINKKGKTILIDFGTSFEESKIPKIFKDSIVGTMRYLSPEKINKLPKYGKASDVYSLGVLMYEAFYGMSPFIGSNVNIMNQILNSEPMPINSGSKNIDELVMSCLSKKPENRPTSKELSDSLNSNL